MNLFSESKYCWNYNWEKLYKRLWIFKQQKHLKTSQNVRLLARGNGSKGPIHSQRTDDACKKTTLEHQSASWVLLPLIQTLYCCNFQKLLQKTTLQRLPWNNVNRFSNVHSPPAGNISKEIIPSKICCSGCDSTESAGGKLVHSCLMWWKFSLGCNWSTDWQNNQLVDQLVDRP